MSEYQTIARGMGKWNRDDPTPKFGWQCAKVSDLGLGNYQICQMCEARRIRYVHTMRHPECPARLEAGCICAGHMERPNETIDVAPFVEAAEARERDLRNRAQRAAGRSSSAAKAAEKLEETGAELEKCAHAAHCRELVTTLSQLRRDAEARAKKAEQDAVTEEAQHHAAFARRVEEERVNGVDKLRALEARQALVESSAMIWRALDNPQWTPSRKGTSTHFRFGDHRAWVYEKYGGFWIAAQLDEQDVKWGKRRYKTEDEAIERCMMALPSLLRKEGLLLPREDPEVAAELDLLDAFIAWQLDEPTEYALDR